MSKVEKYIIFSIPVVITLFIAVMIGFAIKESVDEKERIANMTNEEFAAYTESTELAESTRIKKEQDESLKRAKADEEFETKMRTYETEFIRYDGGIRDSYASYILSNVSDSEIYYTFGENLPLGKIVYLNMSGRGEMGFERKEFGITDWNRAGNYGIYHFEGREIQSLKQGDNIRFSNLNTVEIRIHF